MPKTQTKNRFKKTIVYIILGLLVFFNFSWVTQEMGVVYADPPAATPAEPAELAEPVKPPEEPVKPPAAATDDNTKKIATETMKFYTNFITLMFSLQNAVNGILWPVLEMIGELTENNLLFGAGMEERLRSIWVPIRNIVNIFFVIVLVGIALYNILGISGDDESYSIKKILPNLMIGIIAVNFSFFGIKVFLDGINVLTTSIYALPGQVNENLGTVLDTEKASPEKSKKLQQNICNIRNNRPSNHKISEDEKQEQEDLKYRLVAQKIAENHPGITLETGLAQTKTTILAQIDDLEKQNPGIKKEFQAMVEKVQDEYTCDEEGLLTTKGKLELKQFSSRNAAMAMMLNLSNIALYENLDIKKSNNSAIETFAVNTIFSLVMYVLYGASFIALLVVLLARLVVMWLCIALSPIILLSLVVPDLKDKIGFGEITDQFVKNAVAPLGIAASLSVGWIMLNGIKSINAISVGSKGLPVVGLNTLQDLVVAIGIIAVVWLGVFTAASKTIAAPVTDAIKGALGKVGKFVGELPLKHLPFMPIKIPQKDETLKSIDITPHQAMQAMSKLGDTYEKDNAVMDELRKAGLPIGGTTPPTVSEVNDKKGLSALIQGNPDSKEGITRIKEVFRDREKREKIMQEFRNVDTNIPPLLEKIHSGTAEDAEKAYEELRKNRHIEQFARQHNEGESSSEKSEGEVLRENIATLKGPGEKPPTEEEAKKLTTAMGRLTKILENPKALTRAQAENAIKKAFGGFLPKSAEGLKKFIGEDAYGGIASKFTSANGGDLEAWLQNGGEAPPPPASPAVPAPAPQPAAPPDNPPATGTPPHTP